CPKGHDSSDILLKWARFGARDRRHSHGLRRGPPGFMPTGRGGAAQMVVRFMGLMGLAWAAGAVAGCDAAVEAEALELGLESRECGERRCSRDEACVAGYCEAPCERHQIRCDGECVDRRLAAAAGPAAREFVFTGAAEAFVVPECVAQITVELWGAQ